MDITEAAPASLRHQQLLAVIGHVADALTGFRIGDDGAQRHPDHYIFAAPTSLVPARAMLAILRLVFPHVAEINEGVQTGITFEQHTTATSTVTPVRPTERNILFPAERCGTIPAVPGDYDNIGFINEFHKLILTRTLTKKPRLGGVFPTGVGLFLLTGSGSGRFNTDELAFR